MSDELTVVDESSVALVVDPATGEAIDIARAKTDDLAGFLLHIREQESVVREWKRAVSREILARQDRDASWTTHTQLYTARGEAPKDETEWDAEGLYVALGEYVEAGVITESARSAAVERYDAYKVKASGIRALKKLGGEIVETIDDYGTRSEKRRSVSVSMRRAA